jgi:protein-S-isoprenylcysteine O-methyltransferase Ste14
MKAFAAILLVWTAMVAALFGAAGRLDLPWPWAIFGIWLAFAIFGILIMDPDLRRERLHPGPGGRDRHIRLVLLPLIVFIWVSVGLDIGRFHWSDTVPTWIKALALVGFVIGLCLAYWAMAVNRFFSPVVRIQHERNHVLITSGPYQFVRHPGYLGALLGFLCGTLAFGSWWGMVPAAACVAVMLRRVMLEDAFLKANLTGYTEFAQRVRFRLLPGVW